MSTQMALHSRDRGVWATLSGYGYIQNLVENHFDEYVRAFGITNTSAEDIMETLVWEVTALLKRLENELITTGGVIPLRKKIHQDLRAPEYTLGWMKSELQGWIEWTKKRIYSSLLTEKRMSMKEAILHILFRVPRASDAVTEADIQKALEEWQHQYDATLTDKWKNILNEYLRSVGKSSIEVYIAQNKERIRHLVGPSTAYETR